MIRLRIPADPRRAARGATRAVGFWLTAAVPVVIMSYACGPHAVVSAAGLAGAVLLAAAGVTLSAGFRRPVRSAWPVLVAVSAGLVIGSLGTETRRADTVYTGIPMEHVSWIKAKTRADGRLTQGGRIVVEARLIQVGGRDGTLTDARGGVVIFLVPNDVAAAGETLTAAGRLVPDEDGIAAVFFADAPAERAGSPSRLAGTRVLIRRFLSSACRTGREGPDVLFSALFLGMRGSGAEDEDRLFRAAGAAHIMALSGFHLGLIAFLVLIVLRPVTGRKTAAVMSLVPLAAYLIVVGPRPSLVRAFCVYALVTGFRVFDRRIRMIDAVAASFVILAGAMPRSVDDLSFILSFLALGGIVGFGGCIGRWASRWIPSAPAQAFGAAVSAQIATAVVVAGAFGVLRPIGILASIILAPLVTVFMWLGIVRLAMVLLPYLPAVYAIRELSTSAQNGVYRLIVGTCRSFAEVPGITGENLGVWAGGVSAACLLIWLVRSSYRWRRCELRLSNRHPDCPRPRESQHEKTVRAELPHKPGHS